MTTPRTKPKLGPNVQRIVDLIQLAYEVTEKEDVLEEHNFNLMYHHDLGVGVSLSQLSLTEFPNKELIHGSTVLFFETGVYWAMNVPGNHPTGFTPQDGTKGYGTSMIMGKDALSPEEVAVVFLARIMDGNPLFPPDQRPRSQEIEEEEEEAEWLAKEEGNEEAIRQEWELNQ